MDPIDQYRTEADTASKDLASMQGSAPGMLAELKKNLVGIFAKDNPIIAARETALTDYLSSADRTRAAILPSNLPVVEGSALTLSPTQQNAITSSRQAAALAPLFGLNQIVTGQYGTIGDIIQGAATSYDATVNAAKTRVSTLMDLYKTAVAERDARTKAAGAGGLDLAAIIAAIRGDQNGADGRPDITMFDEPDGEEFGLDPLTGAPYKSLAREYPDMAVDVNQPNSLNLSGYGNLGLNLPTESTGIAQPNRGILAGLQDFWRKYGV